jgi:hypothetical protein
MFALHVLLAAPLAAGSVIQLSPNSSGLPGGSVLQSLVNGLGWWGLIAALAGLIIGAATWALGAHTNNYQHATTGRRAVLVSAAAALIIGAAPTLLGFFYSAGQRA